jgi:hypothetical protein
MERSRSGQRGAMSPEKRRRGQNEVLFREANERITRSMLSSGLENHRVPFLCECSDLECEHSIRLSIEEYLGARQGPGDFVVLPKHVQPDIERVVREHDHYLVVRKVGEARAAAEEADPDLN